MKTVIDIITKKTLYHTLIENIILNDNELMVDFIPDEDKEIEIEEVKETAPQEIIDFIETLKQKYNL